MNLQIIKNKQVYFQKELIRFQEVTKNYNSQIANIFLIHRKINQGLAIDKELKELSSELKSCLQDNKEFIFNPIYMYEDNYDSFCRHYINIEALSTILDNEIIKLGSSVNILSFKFSIYNFLLAILFFLVPIVFSLFEYNNVSQKLENNNLISQLILNVIIKSFFLIIIAISFTITYYTTKFFLLTHAAIISLGAYFTYLFYAQQLFSLPLSIILAIISATIIGISCEQFVYKPMRKRNMQLWHYLIASIGLYVILQNLISLNFGDDTKVLRTGEVTVGHEIFGAYITTIQIVTICVSLILFIAVNLFLNKTRTGKSIKAVSNNPELSNIYGINSNRVILIAFAIGSALAAIAGILSAMDTNMTPTFGFNLLLYGVIAMIIGGVGSTKGLIAGSFLVASAQHLGAYYIDTKWMDTIAFIILIIFLIWKPLGFSGMSLKKVEV